MYTFTGDQQGAADALAKAKAASTLVAEMPLIDANLSIAEAAVAAAGGDDETAGATLAAHAARRQVGEGMAAAPQQRHLALFYVLVPETRAVWERADLGPPWALGRDLAPRAGGRARRAWPSAVDATARSRHNRAGPPTGAVGRRTGSRRDRSRALRRLGPPRRYLDGHPRHGG